MSSKKNIRRWAQLRMLCCCGLEPMAIAPDAFAITHDLVPNGAAALFLTSDDGEHYARFHEDCPDEVQEAARALRDGMAKSFNLNFFSHTMAAPDTAAIEKWKRFIRPHYEHWGLDIDAVPSTRLRMPFGADACAVVEEIAPSANAATMPRPSAIPPAAIRGTAT